MDDPTLGDGVAENSAAASSCLGPAASKASSQSDRANTLDEATAEAACNLGVVRSLPDEGHEDRVAAEDENAAANIAVGEGPMKKKKKKSKPKSQRTAKAGTGFEKYYVDAPLTPAEHEHETGLYHVSLPFTQRVETAVQRYVAKRNMDSARKSMFDKYLIHGGIEAGPKMFSGGLDSESLATGDKQDIALITATNFVPFDKTDPKNDIYVVDFEGCLKAFFEGVADLKWFARSYSVPATFDLTTQESVNSLTGVIRNFLNYLLHHDVCPEYQDQIQASKLLCDQGERELWAIAQSIAVLPGDFNKACSELYGGVFQGQWVAPSTWLTEEESAELSQVISPALALQIFKMGVVANTSNEQFEKYELENRLKSIQVCEETDASMEVIEIIPSNADVQCLYASRGSLKPLGRLLTKTWNTPFVPAEDLTEAEEIVLANSPKKDKFYEFWVEDDILHNCFLGMKIDATVKHLSIGITYFDKISGVYCSFFDISANQRMADWREPEGEGNWLPMRAKGGGPLEERDDEGGNDQQVDRKMNVEDADDSQSEICNEALGGSRLEQPGVGNNVVDHGGDLGTTEEVSQSLQDEEKGK